jgi:DNA-binding response OmpR family regulator
MLRDDQLAEILVQKGLLSSKELRHAQERQLNVEKESLEESLLFLGFTDYRELGLAYAHHFKLPYQPVLSAELIAEAETRFPARMAEQLKFLPIATAAEKGLVIVSCQPDDEAANERIKRTAGGETPWAVASRVEIEDAFQVHYLGREVCREKREIELPFKFRIIEPSESGSTAPAAAANTDPAAEEGSEKKRVILIEPDHRIRNAISTLLVHEGYRVDAVVDIDEACHELSREDAVYILQRRTFRVRDSRLEEFLREHQGRAEIRYYGSLSGIMLGEELSPEALFRNYLSTVKLLLATLTRDQPEVIRKCHLMAHYARLMATSLGLKRKSQEGLILAIYLKEIGAYSEAYSLEAENNILPLVPVVPYEKSAAALSEIEDCFNLAEIIGSIGRADGEAPLEARIITLLLWFIEEFGRPGGKIRKIGAEQFYLGLEREGYNRLDQRLAEELFQIINHEQHLTGQGQSSGTILVLDPTFESEHHDLHTRFIRAGYEVEIVGNRERARTLLRQQTILLIISEIGLEDYDGIAFCKAVKHNSSSLPFIFFSGEDREEMISQALLAGADDFIPKESSDQVAFLKMNRLVQQSHRTGRSETGGGVSGALEEMGFMETIQILANRQKDALITLENPEQKLRAEVYLHEGEIIHAHCGELEGENVIYELLTWQKGFFQVNTPRKLPERNVFGSTEAIMLEGCRLMDESQLENGDLLTMG